MPSRRRFAKMRPVKGVMNANETAYAERLEALKQEGKILHYGYESFTFKLAKDTRFTPDFFVVNAKNEFEIHEVKGGKKTGKAWMMPDAWMKLKIAAGVFPFIKFTVHWKYTTQNGRDNYDWKEEEVPV